MIHLKWDERNIIKQVECVHANAEKYIVDEKLTPGKTYDVINETDEFYFIIDNSDRVGGFYKEYFKEMNKLS